MKKMVFLFLVAAVICSLGSMAQETPGNYDLQQQLLKARELVMQGNRAEASEICLKIMQSNPDNKMAVQFWIIANMERSQEGEQKMEAKLDSLGQHFPGNTGILFFKAFIQAEYGKNEEALATFTKLTILQPDSSVNYVGTGQILYEMHRYREAEDSFNKAISLDPQRFDLYGMKASALSKQEKYSEAVAALDKGIEVNPAFSVNYYNRACMFSLMGNKTKAMDDLAKAISMNPRFRQSAASDEDFKSLYDDEGFKALIK
jgi:predicted Zn-dependent protease